MLHLLRKHDDWRRTWALIVAGDFDGKGATDLLLYDRGLDPRFDPRRPTCVGDGGGALRPIQSCHAPEGP